MIIKNFFKLATLFVCAFAFALNCTAKPVKVIFDTDMGNDVDDALALLMLYSYAQAGKLELLGISVNKSNPYAPVYTNILNDFYGFYDTPVACVKDGLSRGDGVFLKKICEEKLPCGLYVYPRRADLSTQWPCAVEFMRKTLAAQKEDNEVVIISVGLSTVMERLLKTAPDKYSDLDGRALVAKKVKLVSIMAGRFEAEVLKNPLKFPPEWNTLSDPIGAAYLYENCPVPMVWSGLEVGLAVPYPHSSIDKDFGWALRSPLADAYNLFADHVARTKFKRTDGRHDRSCYDLTSVLCVLEPEFFKFSERGDVRVIDEKGRVSFTPDPAGRDTYLIVEESAVSPMVKRLVELCTVRPKSAK